MIKKWKVKSPNRGNVIVLDQEVTKDQGLEEEDHHLDTNPREGGSCFSLIFVLSLRL